VSGDCAREALLAEGGWVGGDAVVDDTITAV
jgi:hypothetical protein